MKADITATGALVLTPETGTEAYALRHWMNRLTPPRSEDCQPGASVIQIDLSAFPGTLPDLSPSEHWAQTAREQLERRMPEPFTQGKG